MHKNVSFSATWLAKINPITFTNASLLNLLNEGGYVIISADRNLILNIGEELFDNNMIENRFQNLTSDVENIYAYSTVDGTYDGAEETSLIVLLHDEFPDEEREFFYQLGEKYHQDSIIYVKRNCPVIQQLIYTTGPLNGTFVEGEGFEILSSTSTDNYSRVRLCSNASLTFTLNFNFDQPFTENLHVYHGLGAEIRKHHVQNRKLNEQHRSKKRDNVISHK